jgi:general stress protein 26
MPNTKDVFDDPPTHRSDRQRAGSVRRLARLRFAIAGFIAICMACGGAPDRDAATATVTPPPPSVPRAELSLARDTAVVLDSADALIARDSSVGLVTVDEFNRPRVRSVRAFRLVRPTTARDRFTVFILTRTSTRKIDQIEKNPLVTLYFNEDQRAAYATIMGRATVHRDPKNPRLQPFLDPATVKFFWPAFPKDFVMLEVTPDWLEFIGPGLWNDPDTWRPQAVVFE